TASAHQSQLGRRAVVAALMGTLFIVGQGPSSSPAKYADDEQRAGKTKTPVFEADVEPLLKAKCARCHGDKARKADLNLGSRAAILKGSESGPVIVPGKPAESKLYEMVHEGKMPPGNKDKLSKAEVESIRRWIEDGARFRAIQGQADLAVTQHDVYPILLRR